MRWFLALAVLAMSVALIDLAAADPNIIIRFATESSDGKLGDANAPLRTMELQIVSERPVPQACFTFNRHLDRSPKVAMQHYIQVEPAIEIAATIRDKVLCVEGFAHAQDYKVRLLAGLPGVHGSLALAEEHAVKIGAMRPSIIFASEGTVLPRLGNDGLPIRTVNIDRVQVEIARVNDRNSIDRIRFGADRYSNAYGVGGSEGEPVWSGELLISNAPNKPVTTALPIDDTIGALRPGLYIATAAAKGTDLRDDDDRRIPPASQWFVVSDLGLTSFVSDEGLLVQVRSLQTAQAVAGVAVALLARNNKELARVASDADGFARFDPGMVRGKGGNRAAAIYAYGADGEFSFVNLEGPALDLSDRGVGGRQIPGPLDVFAYAERGIYRPGETANVVFLLRDDHARAASALPLIVKILSPDGVEIDRRTLTDQGGGSYVLNLALPMTAKSGQWTATAQASPDGATIGSTSFEVGDFVPPRIEFDLASKATIAKRGVATPIEIDARYLYGAPAADLNGEIAVIIRRAQKPYPAFSGYQFGREQDRDLPAIQINPAKIVTDGQGRVSSEFQFKALPDTTQPLEALVHATLFDVGGRPAKRNLTVPVETRPVAIGLKPNFSGDYVDANAQLAFEVMALDPEGRMIERKGLTWELVKVFSEWHFYSTIDGGYRWQVVERDSPRIAGGLVDVAPGQPARIDQQVGRGRYRLEVFDLETGAATSIGFYPGWWSSGDRIAAAPDQVEVTLEQASYAPGAGVTAFVKPPYDSDVLLTLVDRGIRETWRKTIPASGADVTFTLPDDTTAGLYLVANAFAPADPERSELPQRAIGAAWVPIDQSLRKLTVAIDTPDIVEPNQSITVPLTVTGGEGEEVFITLAAIDDGVLHLTDFASPDPLPYYFGKRRLSGDIRDLYGSLIDPLGAERGQVRSGGDGVTPPQSRQLANAPKRNTQVVSLFSGVVRVDDAGHATIPLKLPDFNGRLRLMAVAWSANKVGAASRMLTVRAPVVAELALPLFLAPGDRADITLSLSNLAGPAGKYVAILEADDAVSIAATPNHGRGIALDRDDSYRTIRGLHAIKAGEGKVHLTLIGPDGFMLERDWHISVRPQNPIETRRMAAILAPDVDLKLDWAVADGLFRDTAIVDLNVGSVPDFGAAGLVGTLSRDPYYWTSNMASRAVPLLYFSRTYEALGLGNSEQQGQRMERAIESILGRQVARGTFAPGWIYWSDREEEWLTGYVLDFLTRAHEQGARVPELAYRRGIRWMTRFVSEDRTSGHDLAVQAYAYYVLTRSGNMDAGRLRRFFEARGDRLPTALARAQVGAALARLGDLQMAAVAFDSIEHTKDSLLHLVGGDREGSLYDYATPLRERAAIITMMAESGVVDRTRVTALAAALAKDATAVKYLGAQEMAWLLYLSEALSSSAESIDIVVDGQALPTLAAWNQPYLRRFSVASGAGDVLATIGTAGERPVYLTVSAVGNPVGDLPAEENGFTISRKIVDRFGNPVKLDAIRQNDLLVVIIEGRRLGESGGQTTIVDMLPSGVEIQNVKFDKNDTTQNLAWLGDLSTLQLAEYREDRFVATADIKRYYWHYRGQFRMAYMVRAVTPGEFTMPGIYVEDLFRPNAFARGATTRIRILPSHP
ncbi:alpha-2-macroglobulin family protein [Dongia deserti]|uniref:alpha-2-macroglobulin family protein n=1 Tax=Dongia deserti TaxID=2268030 RepID=UPI000E65C762|nr:alpha-2-macroglobulin [Dongia deserti]